MGVEGVVWFTHCVRNSQMIYTERGYLSGWWSQYVFKVLVHRPEAYPEVEGNAIAVGAGREFFVSVSASHTEGSKAILDFPFEGRSCLFNEERNFPNSEVR